MFKKFTTLVLVLLLCMAFAGCGESNNQDEEKTQNNVSSVESDSLNPESNIESNVESEADDLTTCVSCGNRFESFRGFTYCDSCRCWTTTCGNKRVDGSSFCAEHKCLMCDGIAYDYSPYCNQHRCREYGCDSPAISGEERCIAHLK